MGGLYRSIKKALWECHIFENTAGGHGIRFALLINRLLELEIPYGHVVKIIRLMLQRG